MAKELKFVISGKSFSEKLRFGKVGGYGGIVIEALRLIILCDKIVLCGDGVGAHHICLLAHLTKGKAKSVSAADSISVGALVDKDIVIVMAFQKFSRRHMIYTL